jgi:hypothetical protein
MEIQTNVTTRFGTTKMICNNEVKWDDNGIAKVPNDVGKEILNRHSDTIFLKGNLPQKEVKIPEVGNEELKGKLKVALEKVDSLGEQLELEKKNVQNWKDEFDKLSSQKVEEGGEVIESSVKLSEEDIKVVFEIAASNKQTLEETANDMKLPKEEWEEMNKNDLGLYIAKRVLDANS